MKKIPLYEVHKINDLREMLQYSVRKYKDKAAFMVKDRPGGNYIPISYTEFEHAVNSFGTALLQLGIPNARIAILSETRFEWYVSYLATVNGAGIIIPLDKELPQNEILSLLHRSKADILIYSKSKQKEIDAIRQLVPDVKQFISMDEDTTGPADLKFQQMLKEGATRLQSGDVSFVKADIDTEAMRILLFTSGTTAASKAVMLSHRNICTNIQAMCSMTYVGPNDVFLSVLPIHHTYECTCGFLTPLYRGATVAVCEGMRYIQKNLQESHATYILVVPLMLEMFYKRIIKSATSDPKLASKFNLGRKLSRLLYSAGIDRRRKIFSKIHESFGGRLDKIIAGGAAIDPNVLSGMHEFGFMCLQGYGLTECSPILALNRNVDFKHESAGLPLPGVEIRIIDKDENGIGEIIGKGPNVMIGYYENEDATREAIDKEGFFHTGDLGYIDKDGFVIIMGRKKNVIVTQNGKNIYPEEIEFLLQKDDLVQECLVSDITDNNGDRVVFAEIFPNMELIIEKYNYNSASSDEVRRLISDIVKSVNLQLAPYKYIRGFKVRETEFEKTTSRKIKRQYTKK